MHHSINRIIFITLAITTAVFHALDAPNSYQDQVGQLRQMRAANPSCTVDNHCGINGYCRNSVCQCNDGYITWQKSAICAYKQITKLAAFFVSFFFGALGIDWFMLSRGNGVYIAVGVLKLFMACGGCVVLPCLLMGVCKNSDKCIIVGRVLRVLFAFGASIWWLVDWIRILANAFPDGNGAPLKSW
jgi:hypothetical protein